MKTLHAIASGEVNLWMKASMDAVKYISGLDGFEGVHLAYYPEKGNVSLWFFATENDAKRARNLMLAKGIACGDRISRWNVGDDGVPEFDGTQLGES